MCNGFLFCGSMHTLKNDVMQIRVKISNNQETHRMKFLKVSLDMTEIQKKSNKPKENKANPLTIFFKKNFPKELMIFNYVQ